LLVARSDVVASIDKHRGKWRVRWFDATRKRCSEVHESWNDAAHAGRLHETEARQIRRGERAPAPADRTFDQLCDYWIENRACMKRDRRNDESIIRAHLRPAFGALPVHTITPAHVDAFQNARGHLQRKTVANHLTLLKTMLYVARDMGWILQAPRIRKPRIETIESYQWLRSDREVQRFLESARVEGQMIFALYATAVFTGMRAGELACLTWADAEMDEPFRRITVRRSFNGPTKSGRPRYVPIANQLLPILQDWKRINGLSIVFPNVRGNRLGKSARAFQEVLHRVLRRAGFGSMPRREKLRPYLCFHELRHTFASHWMMKGGDIVKLQRILGHQSLQMTLRYAHYPPEAYKVDRDRLDGMAPKRVRYVLPPRCLKRDREPLQVLVRQGGRSFRLPARPRRLQ